jgi:hypothetical protein
VNDGIAGNATVRITITPIADLSISDVSVTEGNTGTTTTLVFTLKLDAYEGVSSVDYATSDNTATANDDYVAQTGTVKFNTDLTVSGSKSETISIVINGDTTVESDETFTLTLINASNLRLSTTTATGTIVDDEPHLNDTGITWAGEYNTGNKTGNDCSTTTIDGKQDCHYGRDNTHKNDADDLAGFSFTKLDAKGVALADQTVTNHACVKDNITGLIWEVKTTTGVRSNDKIYQWGGLTAIGKDYDDSNEVEENKKGFYYDDETGWSKLVKYANNANTTGGALCGSSEWRVPNIEELGSIAHLGKAKPPAIDQNYFPNTQSFYYWSSSPYVSQADYAWQLNFFSGSDGYYGREQHFHVRLVSGGQ